MVEIDHFAGAVVPVDVGVGLQAQGVHELSLVGDMGCRSDGVLVADGLTGLARGGHDGGRQG